MKTFEFKSKLIVAENISFIDKSTVGDSNLISITTNDGTVHTEVFITYLERDQRLEEIKSYIES